MMEIKEGSKITITETTTRANGRTIKVPPDEYIVLRNNLAGLVIAVYLKSPYGDIITEARINRNAIISCK
jgi:hypothetical protein